MNRFKKHIAIILLAISFQFIVPKELVHELAFHTDTIHQHHDLNSGLIIELPHHHCASLNCFFPPFHSADDAYEIEDLIIVPNYFALYDYNITFQHPDAFANKGPPISRLV